MPHSKPTTPRPWPRQIATLVIGLPICHITGTAWHEIVGHGLTGVAFGGHIIDVHVMGMQIWPSLRWDGWTGAYGTCDLEGIHTETGELCMQLGGSLSTFIVAAIAIGLLWLRRWSALFRTVLLFLSLWWIDLLTYTLPSWGLKRSVLWGGTYSEPYEAAVSLGMPGPLFQGLVIALSAALAAATVLNVTGERRRRRPTIHATAQKPNAA